MGLFGNDRNNQANNLDDSMGSMNPSGSGQQTYIDGVMAAHPNDDMAMQQSVNNVMSDNSAQQVPVSNGNMARMSPLPPNTSHMNNPPMNANHNSGASDDLAQIKQQALQQLSPLVSHLDQSPEEKFHTTMMMLQATDDQSLVKAAFEAAQDITDDKARAQALLDVVNEVNYFTQHRN